MTTTELIAFLEKLPKDTVVGVVYRCCSDYSVLEESELDFVPAPSNEELDESRRTRRYGLHNLTGRFVLRQGRIMEYDSRTWDTTETPVFIPLLVLPGN